MMNETRTFTLDELSALAELPRRTVRFYIQQGLVDRPEGSSRRVAFYTRKHLEQLLTIRRWQDAGLSLDRIRDILRGESDDILPSLPQRKAGSVEIWSHIVINEGIELHIEPEKAGISPEQLRELAGAVIYAYRKIQAGESQEGESRE